MLPLEQRGSDGDTCAILARHNDASSVPTDWVNWASMEPPQTIEQSRPFGIRPRPILDKPDNAPGDRRRPKHPTGPCQSLTSGPVSGGQGPAGGQRQQAEKRHG